MLKQQKPGQRWEGGCGTGIKLESVKIRRHPEGMRRRMASVKPFQIKGSRRILTELK